MVAILVVVLKTRFQSSHRLLWITRGTRCMWIGTVRAFSYADIADFSQAALTRGCEAINDGLAGLRAVAEVSCFHQREIVNGRHPNEMTELRWINTVLRSLKTSFSGTFHALRFDKSPIATWVHSATVSIVDSILQR